MTTTLINQTINVTQIRFGRKFEPIPRRIEFGGRAIHFVDEGIRLNIKHGQTTTRLFDMSDGLQQFRLRQTIGEGNWQLVSISR